MEEVMRLGLHIEGVRQVKTQDAYYRRNFSEDLQTRRY